MRQNTEDLKSFMKDLESWEADIKQRDDDLKSKKTVKESVRLLRIIKLIFFFDWCIV